MRAKETHWPKIEETFKQLDTAEKELECFRALQKQEQLAASHRINNLWEEVQKQKELERTLQKRYGGLLVELERVQHLRVKYIAQEQEQEQEEITARNGDIELTDSAADVTVVQSTDNPDPTSASDELAASHGETSNPQVDGMDLDAEKKDNMTVTSDVNVPNNTPSAAEGENDIPLLGTSGEVSDTHLSSSDGINPGGVAAQNSVRNGDAVSGNVGDVLATENITSTHAADDQVVGAEVAGDVSADATTVSAEVVDLAENAPTQI